jgi:nicotinate phosphoribosyltransferase
MLEDEEISENEYEIFDPQSPWKKKILKNYYVKRLEQKIYEQGKLIYKSPELTEIAKYEKEQLSTIWDEIKRLENPQRYYVDLSKKLWDLKNNMLNEIGTKFKNQKR